MTIKTWRKWLPKMKVITVHDKRFAMESEIDELREKLKEAISRLVTANLESHIWKHECDELRANLAEHKAARIEARAGI